ncbi:MAG TPA: dTDP-4-amino-4,6-dideoxygalactose transaminase [Candidatus Limiplasma sp.]|nr:dTDP-4-amino-4,6-dideoxygalactose transaminase [Candidatus Limiplasma sp.]HRX09850.1 dTDP-4-amino-4,6-dideoxygalactose transaminase [Candidatus Limiplasma sp.]
MIPFNKPPVLGTELAYLEQAMQNRRLSGDGPFTRRCSAWIEARTGSPKALLTTSCTHALELAALLLDIAPGNEVILPSFTFPSTAAAFALRGARLVFVDIRPDTMNLDENLIEAAVTNRTKAIVPVHYAGVSCEMDAILDIARRYRLAVVEDAAQAVTSTYHGQALGSIGDIGCFSFHESKNFSMGEGGAILLQNQEIADRAEILREKGTDRSRFFRGETDRYTWLELGSSYLPSELNAAFLLAQLEQADAITKNRMHSWNQYFAGLEGLRDQGRFELPTVPEGCTHNAHMFYIKLKDGDERTRMIAHLKQRGILSVFHYIPLYSSQAGLRHGRFNGEDRYTTRESQRLLRLPLYYGLTEKDCARVVQAVDDFFR